MTTVTKTLSAMIRQKLSIAAAFWVVEIVRLKKRKRGEKTEPCWKIIIESNLKRNINRLERERR